jgi:hypothetical protein
MDLASSRRPKCVPPERPCKEQETGRPAFPSTWNSGGANAPHGALVTFCALSTFEFASRIAFPHNCTFRLACLALEIASGARGSTAIRGPAQFAAQNHNRHQVHLRISFFGGGQWTNPQIQYAC